MKFFKKIFFTVSILLIFVGTYEADAVKNKVSKENLKMEEKTQLQMARILCGGDVLPHINFDNYARNYGDGYYDYDRFFEKIADFGNRADLFMVNCEFTTNPNFEPSGYPQFNSKRSIFKSLAGAGVDVITTANNHCLDTGLEGLDYTIAAINYYGMDSVGTHLLEREYLIKDINGIKVGILAYAEQLNGLEYLLDTEDKKDKVNMIDRDIIKADIREIEKEGAEFIIIYPHWGVEYSSYPERYQIDLARDMIDWGADMVIGNHPHVIQPREEYITDDGRKGMIYYSLGNLISNQSHISMEGDYRTEQGLLVDTIIYKDARDKKAKILNCSYRTTWDETTWDDYGRLNRVYVVDEYLGGPKADQTSAENLQLMKTAYQMNYETMHTIVE